MKQPIIGFTGSQNGMTLKQQSVFKILIRKLNPISFHHGDCIGADMNAHYLIRNLFEDVKIVIHPPDNNSKRAFCVGTLNRKPKPYLDRNKDIVSFSDIMIACPKTKEEELRSGTWATIRYTKKAGKKLYIINPDGIVTTSGTVSV